MIRSETYNKQNFIFSNFNFTFRSHIGTIIPNFNALKRTKGINNIKELDPKENIFLSSCWVYSTL